MAKYIFYILLGLFLVSKLASTSSDAAGYQVSYTLTEAQFCLSEADVKQCSGDYEYYSCWNDVGSPTGNAFRCASPSKFLRSHACFTAAKVARAVKSPLPQEKNTSFSFKTNPLKASYRYYVYTLRHILV